jgi:aspartyl-tRNA(Asn)/glutamyl-tRNA(Gln) amidotransferase subunit A
MKGDSGSGEPKGMTRRQSIMATAAFLGVAGATMVKAEIGTPSIRLASAVKKIADPASRSDDLAFSSIADLGKAYRTGKVSPVAVTHMLIDRIRRLNIRLNAFITILEAQCLADAEAAERALRSGQDRGPLHGVPIAIKDNTTVAGVPTTFGSRAASPRMSDTDANLVRNLKQAGAIIIGKTNMLEYAYGAVNPDFGQTNNPWDPNRTSGGSSGGSASAVAAGLCFGAVGTDTGGSIRIPAAYCGVAGIKPTYGRVDVEGVQALSPSLDHAGALGRSCADTALMLSGMLGTPLNVSPRTLSGIRVGLLQPPGAERFLEPGVRRVFNHTIDVLKLQGATVHALNIPGLGDVTNAVVKIIEPEASVIYRAMIRYDAKGLSATTRAQFESGFQISAVDYLDALGLQRDLRAAFKRLFEGVDVVLSPAVAWVAPAGDPAVGDERGAGEMLYSGIYDLVGIPALSIPCGLSEGLPVGLQIATPWGADELALSIGAALEGVLPALGHPNGLAR